jgi:transketolase
MSQATQPAGAVALHDCRKAFAETLVALAREDERIVAVCNDSVGSSNLAGFKAEFPARLINVGIAEQDLVGVGAGLANGGMIPFVSAAAPFLTGRALEQVKADVAYSQARVVLCGQSPGFAYGELGPTHHSIEDLSWLRAVAGLPVVVPADPVQTVQAVRWAAANPGPSYLRIPRTPVPDVTPPGSPFQPSRALQLTGGNDVTVIATGTMVSRALQAARSLLEVGIGARVLNVAFVEPLDTEAVLQAAAQTRGIVVAEEATTTGGLGAAVATLTAQRTPTHLRILGVHRAFAPTGSSAYLFEYFGLTADHIAAAAQDIVAHARH